MDQVAHIALFDHEALMAIEAPVRFRERAQRILEIIRSEVHWPEQLNPLLGPADPDRLLARWRDTRTRLLGRLRVMAPGERLPWYGPDMTARSFATARLMETWAHGQDIFDTFRIRRINGASLKHVAHLGVATFGWSFRIRGLTAPDVRPRVELSGPSGEHWEWGEPDAENRVRGDAADFCLVVTQRRNVADTRLHFQGKHAGQWLSIAQAFAGVPQDPPGPGIRVIDYNQPPAWQHVPG
jgi:uncharacterized protein (TIGR03084 family)